MKRTALPAVMRTFLVGLAVAFACVLALPAFADPKTEKDAQALQKKAIQEDSLNVAYGAAIKKLQSAIGKCGADKCSGAIRAQLARDLGAMQILNGSVDEGKSSFAKALSIDASIELDPAYKNPMLDGIWNEVKKKSGGGAPAAGGGEPAGEPAPAGGGAANGPPPPGDFTHSPPAEAPVRTPLPIYAEYGGKEDLKRVVVKYKAPGGTDWKTAVLKKGDAGYGGMIPCRDVVDGALQYFIQGFNGNNDPVAAAGSKKTPFTVDVKETIEGTAPSLPGEEPPKQCGPGEMGGAAESECPPDFPGCQGAGKDAGEDCEADKECKSHSCVENKCAEGEKTEGEACEKDGECKSGTCTEDKKCGASKKGEGEECSSDDECDSGKCKEDKCEASAARGGKFPRIWIGVSVQLDVPLLPGASDVCKLNPAGTAPLPGNGPGYACVDAHSGASVPGGGPNGNANNQAIVSTALSNGDKVAGGFAAGNLRILASVDYALNQTMLVGLRAGYVLFTDPDSNPAPAFAPVHVEGRFTYLFGHNALTKQKIAPLVFVGAGVGEFDAFVPVTVLSANTNAKVQEHAWLSSGPVFASAGGGVRVLLSRKMALTGALKLEAAFGGAAGLLPGIAPEVGIQFGL